MLLIAVDEAGYGPKLGPLVVAATAWQVPDATLDHEAANTDDAISNCFAPLRTPLRCGDLKVVVDDSKKLFKSRAHDPLAVLHAVVSCCKHWCGDGELDFKPWLKKIARGDGPSLRQAEWLRDLRGNRSVAAADAQGVIQHWGQAGAVLQHVALRILTARQFNQVIARGMNKSDLLSDTALRLVCDVLDRDPTETNVHVYCDRHGGRQFYGAVLQQIWPDWRLRVVSESKRESRYELGSGERTMQIRFTVKGDSFPPVAMSSIHAKYLRELMMNALNAFFAKHAAAGQTIRPTAGYPVDADRFLLETAEMIERLGIDPSHLIRCR
ncbi:hypothetical protein Pla52o_42320 [Novipirellula galeiformis]|uniref:Ribonuclease HIII n=1 Tax=Novipirellula galeiformis TaxID=2528004 RepID=A0A5C6CAF8_9BACT|nr:hypothetical protein [Novipirellula galeiformis]TWU21198.1 hypothetical protein Pla52o_42320 [Novipirellula galeiformis]